MGERACKRGLVAFAARDHHGTSRATTALRSDFHMVSGVAEHAGRLFMASPRHRALFVADPR
jgi:hypothetical protein